jgi:hypothetical protein
LVEKEYKGLWWYEGRPHPSLGRKRPDSRELMLRNNPVWKGDGVGKPALHQWVRRRLYKPELCQECNFYNPYDLANVTGVYSRDLSNWKYLCRRCHMESDGRLERLKAYNIPRKQPKEVQREKRRRYQRMYYLRRKGDG